MNLLDRQVGMGGWCFFFPVVVDGVCVCWVEKVSVSLLG